MHHWHYRLPGKLAQREYRNIAVSHLKSANKNAFRSQHTGTLTFVCTLSVGRGLGLVGSCSREGFSPFGAAAKRKRGSPETQWDFQLSRHARTRSRHHKSIQTLEIRHPLHLGPPQHQLGGGRYCDGQAECCQTISFSISHAQQHQ